MSDSLLQLFTERALNKFIAYFVIDNMYLFWKKSKKEILVDRICGM